MKVVVLYSHPDQPPSAVNAPLVALASTMAGITVRHIEKVIPDFQYPPEVVEREHALLGDADLIILQFPTYWYHCPGAMKLYLDNILTYGWAFGTGSTLKGKKFAIITSVGGTAEYYSNSGPLPYSDIYRPFQALAGYCGMTYLDHLFIFEEHYPVAPKLYEDFLKKLVAEASKK